MENNIYDLAILGAGPAGICAAIYATRAKLNTIWLDRKFVQGGQIVDTYEVDNYPGLPGITGLDLGEAMAGHAEKLGLKPKREPVLSVTDEGEIKVIRTKKNEYHARAPVERHTVILEFPERKNWVVWEFPIVQPVMRPFSRTGQLQ